MMAAPAIVTGPVPAAGRSIGAKACRRAGPVRAMRASLVSGGNVGKRAIREAIATRAARGDVGAIPGDATGARGSPPEAPRASVPIQKRVWEGLLGPRASSRDDSSGASWSESRGCARGDGSAVGAFDPDEFIRKLDKEFLVGGGDDSGGLGNQAEAVTKGNAAAVLERALDPDGGTGDLDYLQELIAIQAGGPKNVGFFGTRNMGFLHQQLVEILSYALVLTENHIFTSGATGTNAAVIRGALRAERPDLLTVILPQSVSKQPEESRELLKKVENVVELKFDALPLGEASRKCNDDILAKVQQVICFAFHDSNLLLDTCHEAKMQRKLVALFYLD